MGRKTLVRFLANEFRLCHQLQMDAHANLTDTICSIVRGNAAGR